MLLACRPSTEEAQVDSPVLGLHLCTLQLLWYAAARAHVRLVKLCNAVHIRLKLWSAHAETCVAAAATGGQASRTALLSIAAAGPTSQLQRQRGRWLKQSCNKLTNFSLLLPDQLKTLCTVEPLLLLGLCDLKCAAVLATPARRILAAALQHKLT
jgi:hypothetical protein